MTSVLELHVLLVGVRFVPLAGAGGAVESVPITALARTLNGTILFDTGVDPRHVNDPVRRAVMFEARGNDAPAPMVEPGRDLAAQLQRLGLAPGDVDQVILSHLHAEATGALKSLRAATVALQRAEYDAAFAPGGPPDTRYLPLDYDLPPARFDLVDGDRVMDEGVTVVATPGHTRGHQSLIVEVGGAGPVLLVGGAGTSAAGIAAGTLPPCVDETAAARSLRRIDTLGWELGATVVAGEDPALLTALARGPLSFA